jgi:chemotaxis signal transduction protein
MARVTRPALRCGGAFFAVPQGAVPVAAPLLRPVPGAPRDLLGLALLGGQAVPAYAPGGTAGPCWLAGDGLLLCGDELREVDEGLVRPFHPAAPRAPATAILPGPARPQPAVAPARPQPAVAPAPEAALLDLDLGTACLRLPVTMVLRVLPMPAVTPPPGRLPGALGLVLARGIGPVLLLDAGWLDPAASRPDLGEDASPGGAALPLLAVLVVEGRLCALPCRRVVPATAAPALPMALVLDRMAGPQGAALLALAPLARPAPPPVAIATRGLLLAEAGGILFAVAAEEVAAVVPPQALAPWAGGALQGIAAHRGAVLPVIDGGAVLGGRPVLADGAQPPLLRLAGPRPVALAVGAVLGLRHLPDSTIQPVAGEGLLSAIAEHEGRPLVICRAAALAAALAAPAVPPPAGAAA